MSATSFVVYYDVSNNIASRLNNLLDSPRIEVKVAVLSFSRVYSGENSISLYEGVGEGRFGGDLCDAGWMYARPSYLDEAGNGDDTSSVVVLRPIFTKERVTMLTLCLPLFDIAILQDIDRSFQWFLDI